MHVSAGGIPDSGLGGLGGNWNYSQFSVAALDKDLGNEGLALLGSTGFDTVTGYGVGKALGFAGEALSPYLNPFSINKALVHNA